MSAWLFTWLVFSAQALAEVSVQDKLVLRQAILQEILSQQNADDASVESGIQQLKKEIAGELASLRASQTELTIALREFEHSIRTWSAVQINPYADKNWLARRKRGLTRACCAASDGTNGR